MNDPKLFFPKNFAVLVLFGEGPDEPENEFGYPSKPLTGLFRKDSIQRSCATGSGAPTLRSKPGEVGASASTLEG